jgi:hypothetical protein
MKALMCPVSFREINQNASRLSVFILALACEAYILTGNIYIMAAVAVDYVFRIFEKVNHSPLTLLSQLIFILFGLPKRMMNKGPKVFASRMGLMFALLSIGAYFFFIELSYVFAGILMLCTFLDAVFNVCFGCLIYHYFIWPIYGDRDQ